MSAYTDKLTALRDATLERLAELRTAHKPSYNVNGQTVSWTEYGRMLREDLTTYNDLLKEASASEEPFEIHSQGIS